MLYEKGDTANARNNSMTRGDPAEAELAHSLKQFYPIKQLDMKRSLENVVLVEATALSITTRLGIYVLAMLLIGLALGAISAVRITRPIQNLAEATKRIAGGNFNVRLAVTSRDEVGQLARSFNTMAKTLESTTVSKDYVEGIITSMGDSLIVATSTATMLKINAATSRLLGYTEAELVGKPLQMLFGRKWRAVR